MISDIVSDEEVPEEMQNNPELWSGCVSGAFSEGEFVAAFAKAGFDGVQILKRDAEPWRTVQGIEFRSITLEAFKGKQGASSRIALRHPKGRAYDASTEADTRCCDGSNCG